MGCQSDEANGNVNKDRTSLKNVINLKISSLAGGHFPARSHPYLVVHREKQGECMLTANRPSAKATKPLEIWIQPQVHKVNNTDAMHPPRTSSCGSIHKPLFPRSTSSCMHAALRNSFNQIDATLLLYLSTYPLGIFLLRACV